MVSPQLVAIMLVAAFVIGSRVGVVESKRKSLKPSRRHELGIRAGTKNTGVKGGGVKGGGLKGGDVKANWEKTKETLMDDEMDDEMETDPLESPLEIVREDAADDKLAKDENRRIDSRRHDVAPLVCFVRAAGFERRGTWRFKASAVPVDKCTHVVYSYLETDNKTGEFLFRKRGQKDERDILKELAHLKHDNKKLKVLFSFGGGAHVNSLLNRLHSDKDETHLVDTIFSWINSFGLDGINFHLEGPGPSICNDKDVPKILHFIKKLRLKFADRNWYITAQLPACQNPKCDRIPKQEFARHLDYLFLMTFDYKLDDLSKTKLTSGLYFYEGSRKTSIDSESCLGRWSDAGVPRFKMVPGIATYGRSFTLNDRMYNGVSAKLNQKHPLGYAGNLTKTEGYFDYVETCRRAGYMGWKREWVKYAATPYIYHKDQWVSYDDKDSTDVKFGTRTCSNEAGVLGGPNTSAFVARSHCKTGCHNLQVKWFRKHWMGGVFVWSLEADDHSGDCLGEVFPMVQAAWKPMRGYFPLITPSRSTDQEERRPPQARFIANIASSIFKMFLDRIMSNIQGMFTGGGGGAGENSGGNAGG